MEDYIPKLAQIVTVEMKCQFCGVIVERGKHFTKATCFECRMDKLRKTSKAYQKAKGAKLKKASSHKI